MVPQNIYSTISHNIKLFLSCIQRIPPQIIDPPYLSEFQNSLVNVWYLNMCNICIMHTKQPLHLHKLISTISSNWFL